MVIIDLEAAKKCNKSTIDFSLNLSNILTKNVIKLSSSHNNYILFN